MAYSKVILNGVTLMDVTQDTVTSEKLLQNETATRKDGIGITGSYVAPTFNTQTKSETYTPTESIKTDTITPDSSYVGLSSVNITINAIDSSYIGSAIARKSSSDLTASGSTVTAPAGYYSSNATANVAAGAVAVPTTAITANPTLSVSTAGLVTASVSKSQNVSPTITAGYVSTGAAGAMNVSGSSTLQLTTQAAATITPSETQQTAVASGKYTTGNVVVAAISANYVGSGVSRKSSTDLSASGSVVSVPAGYYASAASKAISAGTEGTPTATKGTVSNHQISITPSVTNSAGYISGGTKTGTAATVSASELVSGTYTFTGSGTQDVKNYASAAVSAGTAGTPTATKGTVSNHQISITPSVTNQTGWITGSTKTGTAATVSASELVSGTLNITSNGNYDVAVYSSATVSVEGGGGGTGEIHQDVNGYVIFSNEGETGLDMNREVTISNNGAVTQALEAGKIYHFTGTLTSLTLTLTSTNMLAHYHFDFLSGSSAPTLNLPSNVKLPDEFQVVSNYRYEIDILNNYGTVGTWAN